MVNKSFDLLSDYLTPIIAQESHAPPVLRTWMRRHLRNNEIETGVISEPSLIPRIPEMMADADRAFLTLPEGLHELRARYELIADQREAYLQAAIPKQREKLALVLQTLEGEKIEKQRRAIVRRVKEVTEKIAQFERPEIRDHIIETARLRARAAFARSRGRAPDPQLIIEQASEFTPAFFEVVEEIRAERNTKEQTRIFLVDQQKILTHKLHVRQRILSVLAELDALIIEEIVREDKSVADGKSTNKSKRRRPESRQQSAKPRPSGVVRQEQPEPVVETKSPLSTFYRDLQKIQNAVQIATEGKNKIRLLFPEKSYGGNAIKQSWQELFREIDPNCRVEFVHYGHLGKTRDFTTPVIVPGGMFTHHDRWDKSKFPNLKVLDTGRPKLLLNHIRAKK